MALARGLLLWLPLRRLEDLLAPLALPAIEIIRQRAPAVNGWSAAETETWLQKPWKKPWLAYTQACARQGEISLAGWAQPDFGEEVWLARAIFLGRADLLTGVDWLRSPAEILNQLFRSSLPVTLHLEEKADIQELSLFSEDFDPTSLRERPALRRELASFCRRYGYGLLTCLAPAAGGLAGYCQTWPLSVVLADRKYESRDFRNQYVIYYMQMAAAEDFESQLKYADLPGPSTLLVLGGQAGPSGLVRSNGLELALEAFRPDLLPGLLGQPPPSHFGENGRAHPIWTQICLVPLTPELPTRVRRIQESLPALRQHGFYIPEDYDLLLAILLGQPVQLETESESEIYYRRSDLQDLMNLIAHPQCSASISCSSLSQSPFRNLGLYYDLPRFFRCLDQFDGLIPMGARVELGARGQLSQIVGAQACRIMQAQDAVAC